MSTKSRVKYSNAPRSINDHLGELRNRLMWTVLSLIVMSAAAYSVNEFIVNLVLAPIGDQKLVYLTPAGGFAFIFQIIIYAGVLLTAPIAIYHLYKFVAPALPETLRAKSVLIMALSTLLLAFGVGFGYFVAVPAALQFLTAFAGDFIQANLTADSYLNFVVAYVLGLGLLFQLPLLLVIWNGVSRIPPGGLWKSQQYVLVGAFVAAALITPTPDVFNQALLAIPIIAMYQIGVLSVYISNRNTQSVPRQEEVVSALPQLPITPRIVPDVVRARATQQPIAVAAPAVHKARQPVNIDGFRVARRSHPVAPPRRSAQPLPMPARPMPQRPQMTTTSRQAASIDGFSFV